MKENWLWLVIVFCIFTNKNFMAIILTDLLILMKIINISQTKKVFCVICLYKMLVFIIILFELYFTFNITLKYTLLLLEAIFIEISISIIFFCVIHKFIICAKNK